MQNTVKRCKTVALVDRTYQQIDAPARTSRAKAVVVLILRLRTFLRLLLREDGSEAQELAEVHVAREVPRHDIDIETFETYIQI